MSTTTGNASARVLVDVFERRAEIRLTADEERETLHAAQTGDHDAVLTLLLAYAPALRAAASRYGAALDVEDLRQEIALGFLQAVRDFDPSRGQRLAGTIADVLTRTVGTAAAAGTTFAIPERTLQRFYGILRRAGGDVEEALRLAPAHEMSRETFLGVLGVLRQAESLDGLQAADESGERSGGDVATYSLWGEGSRFEADVEDAALCAAAFAAVGDFEADVCGLAYGFTDYDAMSDDAVGDRLGFSRQKVQRTRVTALGKMREALAVDVDGV